MYTYCALYEFWGFFFYSFREKKKKKENIHKTKILQILQNCLESMYKMDRTKMATINRGYSKRNSQKRSNFDCFCRTSGFPSGRGPER